MSFKKKYLQLIKAKIILIKKFKPTINNNTLQKVNGNSNELNIKHIELIKKKDIIIYPKLQINYKQF